ncbi:MAG: YchJ family metal-binding protein [Phormidesmis sp.]
MNEPCPCKSGQFFSACCEPYLHREAAAPTAEALMRSRYSAFCKGNIDYLIATHHPDYRDANARGSLRQSANHTQWMNLLIVRTQKGRTTDKTGTVEFVAAYRPKPLLAIGQPQPAAQLHERSQFVREAQQWYYTAGDRLPPYRPDRNQMCWCGSAQPFKQCHGKTP